MTCNIISHQACLQKQGDNYHKTKEREEENKRRKRKITSIGRVEKRKKSRSCRRRALQRQRRDEVRKQGEKYQIHETKRHWKGLER
jgi:prophage antirepressor-like protein